MLVLKKKQIVIATMCMFLSIFTFMFTTATKDTEESEETVSLPVSRKDDYIRCRTWSAR